jgi:FkbM family methyltransferase
VHLTERAKKLALATGLYRPIRNLVGSKDSKLARAKMREFIASLLPNGSLVFDIGAHIGSFSEVYAQVGCNVVAVEPNPASAQRLRLVTDGLSVRVLEAAVGAECGLATLHIGDKVGEGATSTLSEAFMARMEKWDERYKGNWRQQVVVPMITLDSLMAHFGEPAYVKIDVEGYEVDVLRGLSSQLQLLSFEFHNAERNAADACLDRFTEDSEFNFITNSAWGYHEKFDLRKWLDRESFKNQLSALTNIYIEGDIFVRKGGTRPTRTFANCRTSAPGSRFVEELNAEK